MIGRILCQQVTKKVFVHHVANKIYNSVIINISCVYNEANISFNISYKLYEELTIGLTNLNLMATLPKNKKDRDAIGFIISSDKNITNPIISNPIYPRKSRFVEFFIKIPYIVCDDYETVKIFIKNLKTAFIESFEKLKINSSELDTVFYSVLKKVALAPEIYLTSTNR